MRAKLLPLMLPLALPWIALPATAQDGTACANEAQRLSDGIPLSGSPSALGAQQPGSRVDAGMTTDQQSRARNLIQQARGAAQQGDTAACMQRLSDARMLLRESGVGSRPRPSSNPVPSATDQSRPTAGREPLTGEPDETGSSPATRTRGTLGSATSDNSGPGLPNGSARESAQDRMTSPQGAEAPRSATPARRTTRPSTVDSGGSAGSRATTSPGASSGGRSSTGSSSGGGR